MKHNKLKETLFSVKPNRLFSEMEIKLQTRIIEGKLEETNEEKEANSTFTFTLSFFLGSGVFVVILLLMKKKNKESQENNKDLERKNKLIEKKNNEKQKTFEIDVPKKYEKEPIKNSGMGCP